MGSDNLIHAVGALVSSTPSGERSTRAGPNHRTGYMCGLLPLWRLQTESAEGQSVKPQVLAAHCPSSQSCLEAALDKSRGHLCRTFTDGPTHRSRWQGLGDTPQLSSLNGTQSGDRPGGIRRSPTARTETLVELLTQCKQIEGTPNRLGVQLRRLNDAPRASAILDLSSFFIPHPRSRSQ